MSGEERILGRDGGSSQQGLDPATGASGGTTNSPAGILLGSAAPWASRA